MPYHKTCRAVFIDGGPIIVAEYSRQSIVSRMVTVKGLVLVQEIILCKLILVSWKVSWRRNCSPIHCKHSCPLDPQPLVFRARYEVSHVRNKFERWPEIQGVYRGREQPYTFGKTNVDEVCDRGPQTSVRISIRAACINTSYCDLSTT